MRYNRCEDAETYSEGRIVTQGSWEEVTNSQIHGDREQIMLKDNETRVAYSAFVEDNWPKQNKPSVRNRCIPEDILEGLQRLLSSRQSACDPPVYKQRKLSKMLNALASIRTVGVVLVSIRTAGPDDGDHSHGKRNCTNAIIYIPMSMECSVYLSPYQYRRRGVAWW
jgi:hypothetical protein